MKFLVVLSLIMGSLVAVVSGASAASYPDCPDASYYTVTGSNGIKYGWYDGGTCIVQPEDDNGANNNGTPTCPSAKYATVRGSNGVLYGWYNGRTCIVDEGAAAPAEEAPEEAAPQPRPGNGKQIQSTLSPVKKQPADTCLTRRDTQVKDYHNPIRLGDFILATNAWNHLAGNHYAWEQCIYANKNGAKAGWRYDWGPSKGPTDYAVRAYPELIYGVKSQGEISAPKSVTGLPERVGSLPNISIDYSFSGSEYGASKRVANSVNPAHPNGSSIRGERNIAVESFFHPADANGNCGENVVQRGAGYTNHTFELMVWLDAGAERLPSSSRDYVTDATIGGQRYAVYTKSSESKYIAFVAKNPRNSGTINWTEFIDWTQANGHQVKQKFGARTNSVQLTDNMCLGSIMLGTEIWWGAGDFNINNWTIRQG